MKNILIEGKYDYLTKTIVNDVIHYIKETEGELDTHNFEFFGDESYKHDYSGIEINLDLTIQRVDDEISFNDKRLPYYINSYVATDDFLVIEIIIDESFGREYYQEIYYKLNEDIRHEIEHYVQQLDKLDKKLSGLNKTRFMGRQQPLKNTASYESVYLHHKDPSEVEALVRGFYRRARLEKLPLDIIMHRDLIKDIEDGNLTKKQAINLLKLWLNYAKKNLPNAIYSNVKL